MTATDELTEKQTTDKQPPLFQVWIDVNCGLSEEPDWWTNDEPKQLEPATKEWLKCLSTGWKAKLLPEGQNPRADGRWDNP